MNIAPTAAPLGRPRSSGGSFGSLEAGSSALGSPTKIKSKRPSATAGFDSSGSEDEGDGRSSKRRQPGVKRACNECRQQKVLSVISSCCCPINEQFIDRSQLKCDVATEPVYQSCERCRRLKLTCRIDSNFRRIGKRSEKAQMEKEIIELRAQLAGISQQSSPVGLKMP